MCVRVSAGVGACSGFWCEFKGVADMAMVSSMRTSAVKNENFRESVSADVSVCGSAGVIEAVNLDDCVSISGGISVSAGASVGVSPDVNGVWVRV